MFLLNDDILKKFNTQFNHHLLCILHVFLQFILKINSFMFFFYLICMFNKLFFLNNYVKFKHNLSKPII